MTLHRTGRRRLERRALAASAASAVAVDQMADLAEVAVGGIEVSGSVGQSGEVGSQALQVCDASVEVGGAAGDEVEDVTAGGFPAVA